eukprot:scaffold145003_cov72-Phaeocystis_antarctica.AAC.2
MAALPAAAAEDEEYKRARRSGTKAASTAAPRMAARYELNSDGPWCGASSSTLAFTGVAALLPPVSGADCPGATVPAVLTCCSTGRGAAAAELRAE